MAVSKYEKDGKQLWQVYLDMRSRKIRSARVQKRIVGFDSERAALIEEKRLMRELTERLSRVELRGACWGDVIDHWVEQQRLYPSSKMGELTVIDHEAVLRNYTKPWMDRPASDINRADARDLFHQYDQEGRSRSFRKRLKTAINKIYSWGIEERLICGVQQSPASDIELIKTREETPPEILSNEEIRLLLEFARDQRHPWYPIWVSAVLTGCRSGELHQLRRNDVEIISPEQALEQDALPASKKRYGFIRVARSWNVRLKKVKSTKAGYWRTVPVSSEYYWFLIRELKIQEMKPSDFILPRFWEWDKSEQARVLRAFCLGCHLPSIRFHTLRACFATQLISTGTPPTVVMKICGWKDLKTMQRYIRLAGIDEAGATESLRFIPSEEATMEKVVSLFGVERPVRPR